MPMSLRTAPHGTSVVDGIVLQITRQTSGDHDAFQVHRADTGADLTADMVFDRPPTLAELTNLLDETRGLWRCHCGHRALRGRADLIDDHLRDCTAPAL